MALPTRGKGPKGRPPKFQQFPKVFAASDEFLADKNEEHLKVLHALALGDYYEEVREGKEIRVYKARPDAKSLMYLIDRMLYRASSYGDMQLAEARAEFTNAQLKAGIPNAQAQNLESQTEFNREQTALSKASLVTEEIFQKGVQQMQSAIIGYFQRMPRVDLHAMLATEEGYYALQTNLTAIMEAESARVLQIEAGPDDEL